MSTRGRLKRTAGVGSVKSIRLSDIGAGFDRSTSSALACRPTKTHDVPSAQRVTVRGAGMFKFCLQITPETFKDAKYFHGNACKWAVMNHFTDKNQSYLWCQAFAGRLRGHLGNRGVQTISEPLSTDEQRKVRTFRELKLCSPK